MNHQWSYPESNFQTHQSQQGLCSYQEYFDPLKFGARAYVNPNVVNYEDITRSLGKPPFRSNRIHVNPNFKRNQEEFCLNFNNLIFSNHSYSGSNDLSHPGTSNTSNSSNNKIINSKTVDPEITLSRSRFKKINKVSLTKPKYSWCKNENASELSKSSSTLFLKSTKNCKKAVPVLGQNMYKFVAPKKTKIRTPEKSIPRLYISTTKIINKSKTKLVNNNLQVNKKVMKVYSPIKIPFCKFQGKIKKSVTLKVTNKYKYYNNAKQSRHSRFKIDKRNKTESFKKGRLNQICDISKLFPNNIHARLKLFQQTYDSIACKNFNLQRKNELFKKVSPVIAKKFPNIRVVKIGGILYKTTKNKLTLARNKEQKRQVQTKLKNHAVYVRGEKFLLENNGKTLRRQPEGLSKEKKHLQPLKRIDIGGVTYIQKSKNVLVRTNIHHTQYLVKKAKNKSIAILTNLRKKSTMPCMIYHKFGKCNRHKEGLCMYKHDPKNIAICKMFLKGDCTNNNCLLSHQAIPEKMATCHFFLNGFCDRENCPFPHVKLNENVAICEKFLQGFCKLGKDCSERHLHQCPNFDKFGTCSLGSKCHYPHKLMKKNQIISENTNEANESNEKVQYLINSVILKHKGKLKKCLTEKQNKKGVKKRLKAESLSWDSSDQTNDIIKCVPKRIKLDKLPCYIPLKNDNA